MVNFSTALTLLLAVNGVSGLRQAREKQGKRQLSTKAAKCPKSTTQEDVVSCKQTISGTATLQRNLYCPGLGQDEAAIIMDGPDAVLDCAGKAVIGDCTVDPPDCSAFFAGIRLLNGATAVNCIATRFAAGYLLDGNGDNQVIDSIASRNPGDGIDILAASGVQLILRTRVIGNGADGIFDESTSTSTTEIKESLIAGNADNGIYHETTTSMIILESSIFGNSDGITVLNGNGTVQVENTNIFNNQDNGIYAGDGTVTLKNVENSFNVGNNIEASNGPGGATGKVDIDAGVYACGATSDDVDENSGGDVDATAAQPVCVNGTTFTECMEGCDQPGNASALVCV